MASAALRTKINVQPEAVSPALLPYLLSKARFRLFWGGRDGTKSDFDALDLLLQCLSLPYFKCILIRKVFNTIGESQMATLRKVAEREGLLPFFDLRASPLMIKCRLNGNTFICRGLDDPARLKSVSDPTHAWYEEANQISEEEANYVSTSLRSSHPGAVIQEIYSFNPDHEGDYKTFWLWKKFFDGTGHPDGLTFSGVLSIDVNGQLVQQRYEVVHTTYRDNPWCPSERAATYESYATTDPYRHRVWALGVWATKQTGNEFYPMFKRVTHAATTVDYKPGLPIFQSWDANSLPYNAMLCCQPDDQRGTGGKLTLRFFKEYAIKPPNASIKNTGLQFLLDRQAHKWQSSAVRLTGDASLRNHKTGEQRTESNFNDVLAALMNRTTADGTPVPGCLDSDSAMLWPKQNPGVNRRRDFINYVLAGGLHDVVILFDSGLANTIEDLELVQKSIDGKVKEKVNDKALNVTYEKRGHFSDVFDYAVCTLLAPYYEAYKGGK